MSKKYEKLQIDGTDYKTTFTKKWSTRKQWEVPNPAKICAHIPGTIRQLYVKVGQEVKAGELLIILQAMKMDNEIIAPFDAKVKKIYVKEGEKVPGKTLMLELS